MSRAAAGGGGKGLLGGDPVSTVGYLAQTLQCHGVMLDTTPHTLGTHPFDETYCADQIPG